MNNVLKFKTKLELFIDTCSQQELTDDDLFDFGLRFSDINKLIDDDHMYYDEKKDKYVWN